MRHIKSCRANDILQAPDGSKCKVLARLGPLIFRSEWYRYEIAAYHHITVTEAEQMKWKVLTRDGREPVDIKELERLMPNIKII